MVVPGIFVDITILTHNVSKRVLGASFLLGQSCNSRTDAAAQNADRI
jgi:hypothetical protein